MEELIRILTDGNYSLVLEKDGQRYTFTQRGVADLHALYHAPEHLLDGAMLADKVVGKGAAALMVAGGVRRVHALTISEPALELLRDNAVEVTYGLLVPHIINRKGDGICPVEKLCSDCRTAEECLPLIDKFVESLKNK